MGKLIKNHWARLIVLAAAALHVWGSLNCYFWPKVLFDWLTKNLDGAVKPVPILQTVNLLLGFVGLAYEWPLAFLAGHATHKSIALRLFFYPLSALAAVLMYQGTDAALYYMIGVGVYFWAYTEGEVVCSTPWRLPKK